MKKRSSSIIIYIIITLILSINCGGDNNSTPNNQTSSKSNITEVIILHTNDTHGKIDNYAKIVFIAKQLRQQYKNVFLVSGGDIFSGNPIVDQYTSKGYPMIDLMNKAGYNFAALGNHEFDYGQSILNDRIQQANFPFICANLIATGATLIQPKPYAITQTTEGIKIAFLGLIQVGSDGIPASHPDKLTDIVFSNPFTTAKNYTFLKTTNHLLIALSHLGQSGDNSLANQMPELDIIIGGHSHSSIDPAYKQNNVLIAQAGGDLHKLGKIYIKIENGVITEKRGELIDLDSMSEKDSTTQAAIDSYNNNNPTLTQIIGHTVNSISGKDDLGAFMTDAITNQTDAEIAFQNSGGIRTYSIGPGYISAADIYTLDPFNNEIIIFNMTTNEIYTLIASTGPSTELKVAGFKYTISGSSVFLTDKYGTPLADRTYKVALSSYIASAYTFTHADPGAPQGKSTSTAIIDYVKTHSNIAPPLR